MLIVEYPGAGGLVPGIAFGDQGEGWLRLCYASKLETLSTALDRLESHIETM